MTSRIPIYPSLAVLAIAVLVVGCSPASGDASHAHSAEASSSWASHASEPGGAVTLTYYLDQVGQDPHNLLARQAYEDQVKACQGSGLKFVPLRPSAIAKLGVRHVRVWQKPGREARQIDTWELFMTGHAVMDVCNFGGVKIHSVREVWAPPDRIYSIDLTKGTGTYEVTNPYSLKRKPIPESVVKTIGNRVAGRVKTGQRHDLGQPCDVWRYVDPNGNGFIECDWSGGRKWGIGSIVLSRKTIGDPSSISAWLKTNAFDVGHLPAGSNEVFEIPKKMPVRERAPPEDDVQ